MKISAIKSFNVSSEKKTIPARLPLDTPKLLEKVFPSYPKGKERWIREAETG